MADTTMPDAAMTDAGRATVARLAGIGLDYGTVRALDGIDLEVPAGQLVGLIGPDGVGKSSLLALIAGARALQRGQLEVLGGDLASARHRRAVCPRIAYMPQGLGRNLYPTLSIAENLDFFASLFGQDRATRAARIAVLTAATGLAPFVERAVGKLSGGMKQKLGLCCALIHDPDLLILDEPTTGVDPLSRRQFWELIANIRATRPGLSVLVATAYMEEAEHFDGLVAMDAGRILAQGSPRELRAQGGGDSLEAAFIGLLPATRRREHRPVEITPRAGDGEVAIEARDLTMTFGAFTAVDRVSFRIQRGEIFGFIGSNGCGKTTTMKLLTGLMAPSGGQALLFGHPLDPGDLATRRRVGYLSQSFSLYGELSVRQNLRLHARLFALPPETIAPRVATLAERFELGAVMDSLPGTLPLGVRQRLSLAVALIHDPELLILDEPTSGVDPIARDRFWRELVALSRRDGVTIFISTHFMNEAERCDRVALMHAGRVLATAPPRALAAECGVARLEDAFIAHLATAKSATAETSTAAPAAPAAPARDAAASGGVGTRSAPPRHRQRASLQRWRSLQSRPSLKTRPSLQRLLSLSRREGLELSRDPVRLTLALLGSLILMLVMGYGITLDVDDLSFAVLDRDQTTTSRDYALNLAGSRYFAEHAPLADYDDLDRRMRAGTLGLAVEIPAGFARDLARGRPVQVAAWIDGAMPTRAETIRGYVQGIHAQWLAERAVRGVRGSPPASAQIEIRFRYNPDLKSLVAMVPAMLPLLLLLIPAMLAALAVVREKELGSIVNLYVTPVSRAEFLLGKQLPYVVLAMFNFVLLWLLAVLVFRVPMTGSLLTLSLAALLYVTAATTMGLLISTFMRSQIAALFGTAVLSILPAVEFSGMIDPVSSLQGAGRAIGLVFPTTYFLLITRGAFSKGLRLADLYPALVPLALAIPVLLGAAVLLTRKQER